MKISISMTNPAQFCACWPGFIVNGFSAHLVESSKGNEKSWVRQDKERLLETLSHCLHIFLWEVEEFVGGSFPQPLDFMALTGRL